MRSILFLLLIGFVFTGIGCGDPATETEETTEEAATTEGEPMDVAPEVVESGENYEILMMDAEPTSPRKELQATVGGAAVVINYGSPSVKGRQIWGEGGLEPYDEVWRTGANEVTTFEVTQDVTIEGETLSAGKYGLFTIPGAEEWVIIFNENGDQWGDSEYDESQDVLRVSVTPQEIGSRETMDFVVDGDAVVLQWADVAVPFTVAAAG